MNRKHKMTKAYFYLTDAQIKVLKEISEKDGRSVSELIRKAIDTFIEEQKRESEIKNLFSN